MARGESLGRCAVGPPASCPRGTNPGRTHRFFTGTPVVPFGFGLSYSDFDLTLDGDAALTLATDGTEMRLRIESEDELASVFRAMGEQLAKRGYAQICSTGVGNHSFGDWIGYPVLEEAGAHIRLDVCTALPLPFGVVLPCISCVWSDGLEMHVDSFQSVSCFPCIALPTFHAIIPLCS